MLIRVLIYTVIIVVSGILCAQQYGDNALNGYTLGCGIVFFVMSDLLTNNKE